jgi:hypothetical protein
MLSVWCKIAGNTKSNHVSLMSYYATVRDKITSTPAEKVMPRLRAMLADLMYPDAEPSMPNFDQWTTPSLTNTTQVDRTSRRWSPMSSTSTSCQATRTR